MWFLIAVISLAVLLVFLYALWRSPGVWDLDEGPGRLSDLRRRKDRMLRAIKDLEEEKEAGRLEDAEFQVLRNDFKQRAVEVMRELDRLRAVRVRRLASQELPAFIRRRVEAEVARRRKGA
jgi:hypothetical protein